MAETTDVDRLASLVAKLNVAVETLKSTETSSEEYGRCKIQISQAARMIGDTVKSPSNCVLEHTPSLYWMCAARLFVEWGLFNLIPPEGSITYNEMAVKADADVEIVMRLAWVLVATGLLKQTGPDRIAHTPQSKVFLGGFDSTEAIELYTIYEHIIITFARLPAYYARFGRRLTMSTTHNPFTFAFDALGQNYWNIFNRNEMMTRFFMKSMEALNKRGSPAGSYDFGWLAELAATQPDRTLLVDVGGSRGHALKAVLDKFPSIPPERCVLQDRPEVINAAREEGKLKVKMMDIDFHQDEPIKWAGVYYMRHIIHDYGDNDATHILKVMAAAMASDSRLLIVECVLDNPPTLLMSMSALGIINLGGMERTLEGFERILEGTGLKVVEVHCDPMNQDSMIECVKI